ncbi:hypothetical protein MASSI9I_100157 [Massilia sp. 9I]|nr:hypothetical protein MASSI9I_100157 [Massilia sp. 9I]
MPTSHRRRRCADRVQAWANCCRNENMAAILHQMPSHRPRDPCARTEQPNRQKKSPLPGSGLNLFPWRRIEETGRMMLQCRKLVQFIFLMTAIKIIDESTYQEKSWRACDADAEGIVRSWCVTENVLGWQLC